MNSHDKETLSAMLDNEADALELRRMLKMAGEDPQLADTWQRMSLVQAILHDDNLKASKHMGTPVRDFSNAVMQAIADEPMPQVSGDKTGAERVNAEQWTQPLAKLAIAASVALAFFLGMQTTVRQAGSVTTPVAQQQTADEVSNDSASPSRVADVTESAVREVDPAARQRLEEYIRSVSITREEPQQLEQLQESPLYRLVNEIQDSQ